MSEQVVQRLDSPKLAQLIAEQFRRDIVTGQLPGGSTLPPENDLAAQFNVSKPVAREAIRILEADGLVEVRRGGHNGAMVRQPDVTVATRHAGIQLRMRNIDLRDVWLARAMVECEAIRIVAEKADPVTIANLRGLAAECERAAASKDVRPFLAELDKFRDAIVELSGNETLKLLHVMLFSICDAETRMMNEAFDPVEIQRRAKLSANAVKKVVGLMEAGGTSAEDFWRQHMTAIGQIIFDILGPSEVRI
jgi:GntR family transcriptional repressor for pyruvate dehydrogenase complex